MLPSLNSRHSRGKNNEKRLDIARRLAAEYLGEKKQPSSSTKQDAADLQPSHSILSASSSLPTLQNTAGNPLDKSTLLQDGSYSSQNHDSQAQMAKRSKMSSTKHMKNTDKVYNMALEKKMITDFNFLTLETELSKLLAKENNKISLIVDVLMKHLKTSLFGCDFDIGICTDSSLKEIEYFGDSNYIRKVQRKNGITSFTCIDRKTIVFEAIGRSKARGPVANRFSVEDSVTYVPLNGKGGMQGVLEIYGLQTNDGLSTAKFERSDKVLRAMIFAKDFKFSSSVRLWKIPNIQSKANTAADGFELKKDPKFYQVVGFLLAGYIMEVCYTKKGVPYYGGPRYKIKWENGEVDEEVSPKDLLDMYKRTPRSLGCCSILDDSLSTKLMAVGELVGRLIENQKLSFFLRELRSSINRKHLSYHTLTEIALQAVTTMISRIRDISLIGFNSEINGCRSLVEYFPAKIAKASLIFDLSVFDIVERHMKHVGIEGKVGITADKNQTDWIAIELLMNKQFYWITQGDFQRYFIVINRDRGFLGATSTLETSILESVSIEISRAVELIWQNQLRKNSRNNILRNMSQKLFEWNTLSLEELCYNSIDLIKHELHGANIYAGLLQIGGNDINFVAASFRSKMEGQTLKRGEGISFGVIDSVNTYILNPSDVDKRKFLFDGSIVQALYGRKRFRAKIIHNRGHEKYDIQYLDDRKMEAGVDLSRIIPIDAAFDVKVFAPTTFPYLCIPMKNRNKPIGVIGVDGIMKIPTSPWVSQPDPEFVAFLESFGNILGSHIDIHRKKLALKNLSTIAKSSSAGITEIMDSVFDCLYTNLQFITGVEFTRFIYSNANSAYQKLETIQSKGEISVELVGKMRQYNLHKASQKNVQKVGEQDILMLFKLTTTEEEEGGKVYLLGISNSAKVSDPDHSFMLSLQKIVSSALQNILSQNIGTILQADAMRGIRDLCTKWRGIFSNQIPSSANREEFFAKFVENIHICYSNVNMYVGLVGMNGHTIQYFLASALSEMKGKVLKKPATGNYVSFEAVESMIPIVIVNKSDPKSANMFHFGQRLAFEFPFVAVPLVAFFDAAIGVLGIDACDDLSSESSTNIEDLISFFRAAGLHLTTVVRSFKVADARTRLKLISTRASSFLEGFLEIKKLLLEFVPSARRVVGIIMEPHEISTPESESSNDVFIVVVHIIEAVALSKVAKAVYVECIYQGKVVLSSKIDGLSKQKPFKVFFPNSSKGSLGIRLLDSSQKVVGKTSYGLNYFLNVAQVEVDVFFDSVLVSDVRVGQMKIISKVLLPGQIVGLSLIEFQLVMYAANLQQNGKNLNLAKDSVFVALSWNGNEIYKSATSPLNSDSMEWKGLNLYFKTYKSSFADNDLEICIWTRASSGKCDLLGTLAISALQLIDHFESAPDELLQILVPVQSNKPLPKNEDNTVPMIRIAAIRLMGAKVEAENLTDGQMLSELNTTTANVNKIAAAPSGTEKPYHSCELSILCARDLMMINSDSRNNSTINSYVCLYFNGIEIGKSSIVFDSANPIWSEEVFTLRIPIDEEIEESYLYLEVFHSAEVSEDAQSDGAEDVLLGRAELIGSTAILNLLAGDQLKARWYDLFEAREVDNEVVKVSRGEIKVSGKPSAIKAPIMSEIVGESNGGLLFVSAVSFANLDVFDYFEDEKEDIFSYCIISFNGRQVLSTTPTLPARGTNWVDGSGIFRKPQSRSIKESKLTVDVWQSCSSWRHAHKIGQVNITDSQLDSLLSQNGIVTRTLQLMVDNDLSDSVRPNSAKFPTVLLKAGPQNGREIFEESDSSELWLDIMAAVNLPFKMDSENVRRFYPDSYCVVTWNDNIIGKTKIVASMRNPRWEKERFLMKRPIHFLQGENALLYSRLKIDIYSLQPDSIGQPEILATTTLTGDDLNNLFLPEQANFKWVELKSLANKAGQDKGDMKIRLRGSCGLVTETINSASVDELAVEPEVNFEFSDYEITIVSASGLSAMDAYGNTCPYAKLEWCGEPVGRTNTIVNDANPNFDREVFYVSTQSGIEFFYTVNLVIQLWSHKKSPKAPVFLGHVVVDGAKRVRAFLEQDETEEYQSFTLAQSVELTEEENAKVGGQLNLRCRKIRWDMLPRSAVLSYSLSLQELTLAERKDGPTHTYASLIQVRINLSCPCSGEEELEVHRTAWIKRPVGASLVVSLNEILTIHTRVSLPDFELGFTVWDSIYECIGRGTMKGSAVVELVSDPKEEAQTPVVLAAVGVSGSIGQLLMSKKNVDDETRSQPLHDHSTENLVEEISSAQTESVVENHDRSISVLHSAGEDLNYSIRILSARGLAKMNTFGKGSDTYAEISWETPDTPMQVVGKTAIVPNSLDPVFSEDDIVKIVKPVGVDIKSCAIKISLYAKVAISSDVCLGECTLSSVHLAEWMKRIVPSEYPLEGDKGTKSKNVQGFITVVCKKSMDVNKSLLFNLTKPLPKYLRPYCVDILSVTGLQPPLDASPTTVQCILHWGPVEFGRTEAANLTQCVIYDVAQGFPIRIPYPFSSSKVQEEEMGIACTDLVLIIEVFQVTVKASALSSIGIGLGPATSNNEVKVLLGRAVLHEQDITDVLSQKAVFYKKSVSLFSSSDQKADNGLEKRVEMLFCRQSRNDFSVTSKADAVDQLETAVTFQLHIPRAELTYIEEDAEIDKEMEPESLTSGFSIRNIMPKEKRKVVSGIGSFFRGSIRSPISVRSPAPVLSTAKPKSPPRSQSPPQSRSISPLLSGYFLRIRLNGRFVGRSHIAYPSTHSSDLPSTSPSSSSLLSVSWVDEWFSVKGQSNLTWPEAELQLEIWRYQAMGDVDTFVGVTAITSGALVSALLPPPSAKELNVDPKIRWGESKTFPLQSKDFSIVSDGKVELELGKMIQEDENSSSDANFTLELTVLGINDFNIIMGYSTKFNNGIVNRGRRDGKDSLIYALCRWKGREIARSDKRPKNSSSIFNLKVEVSLTGEETEEDVLKVELWNQVDSGLKGICCLGWVRIPLTDICDSDRTDKDFAYPLESKSNSSLFVSGMLSLRLRKTAIHQQTSSFSLKDCLWLRWGDKSHPNPPLWEIKILSLQGLPIPSTDVNTSYMPSCRVTWNGKEVGSTQKSNYSDEDGTGSRTEPSAKWENQEFFLPSPTQMTDEILTVEVWDKDWYKQDSFLGCVHLSFKSLLKLYSGEFSFPMQANKALSPVSYITGQLTMGIYIRFPLWDNILITQKTTYIRRFWVQSAFNLPKINGFMPSCKFVVLMDGQIIASSAVVKNSSSPIWLKTSVEINVDISKGPIEVSINLIHVNSQNRKEVLIGLVESVPFEYFLRPPKGVFELILTPPPESKRVKAYKFLVSGHLNACVEEADQTDDQILPYSVKAKKVIRAYNVADFRQVKMKQSTVNAAEFEFSGEILSEEERRWLGTTYNFRSASIHSAMPQWVSLPVNDMNMMVVVEKKELSDFSAGCKTAICIERDILKCNVSDAFILADVLADVSNCLTSLRRKDVYKTLRAKVLRSLANFLSKLSTQSNPTSDNKGESSSNTNSGSNDNSFLMNIIKECVLTCFPGSVITLVTFINNLQAMRCERFKDTFEGANLEEEHKYTLHVGQGSEWMILDKASAKSVVLKSVSALKESTHPIVVQPSFLLTKLPRISVGVHADDVYLGLFHVSDFTVHQGGVSNPLTVIDEMEIRTWLEAVGGACGEFIFSENEKKVLNAVSAHSNHWDSSWQSIAYQAIHLSVKIVFFGRCKLAELLAIDQDRRVKSLGHKGPAEANAKTGGELFVEKINITCRSLQSKGNATEWLRAAVGRSMAVRPKANQRKDDPITFDAETIARWKATYFKEINDETADEAITAFDGREDMKKYANRSLIIGIACDGFEQCQPLTYDSARKKFNFQPVKLVIRGADRQVNVSLYEVDDALNICSVLYGSTSVVSFKESELSTSLHTHKSSLLGFDITMQIKWTQGHEDGTESGNRFSQDEMSNLLKDVKGFSIQVHKAVDFKAKSGFDSSCEIFFGDKFINRTTVQKNTLTSTWDESIFVPFAKKRLPVAIEVYEMKFMRKGAFLGRVEIPFDELMHPPSHSIEKKLEQKANMNVKKQGQVGGTLTISHSVEFLNVRQATADSNSDVAIREELWSMVNPTVELTIKSALNLAKANRFGGSSDPFCVVYLGEDTDEPICKTKVIDNTLNPQWKETFNIKLNIVPRRGVTTIQQFPPLRLEVYDYNLVAEMPFLGSSIIPPSHYLSIFNADYELKEMPNKKNDLVQGSLSVSFALAEGKAAGQDPLSSFIFSDEDDGKSLPFLVLLDVQIIKAVDLMIANRVGGKSDPFVMVKWNGQVVGETSYKKGNLNPQWSNESFQVDLGSRISADSSPLILEVYDKDFFKEGDFLGQVVIPCNNYLHPSHGTQSAPLKPRPEDMATPLANKIKGTLYYSLAIHYKKQKPLSRIASMAAPPDDASSSFPPSSAMSVLLASDPSLEKQRYQKEGLSYPQMEKKIGLQMQRYVDRPFERTGVISELHYGQLMAASIRADSTTLKSHKNEIFCLPCGRKGACFPMPKTNSAAGAQSSLSELDAKEKNSDEIYNSAYLCFRFPTNRLARRDVQFFAQLKSTLAAGVEVVAERNRRRDALEQLLSSIRSFSATASDPSPSLLLMQVLLDMQTIAFPQSTVRIYLLKSNHKDSIDSSGVNCPFTHVSLKSGDTTSADDLDNSSSDIVTAGVDQFEITSAPELQLLTTLPRLCRHEVVVQLSQGKVTLNDFGWTRSPQHVLPMWDNLTVQQLISAVEGSDLAPQCMRVFWTYSEGMLAIPLIAFREVFVGLLWINLLDRSPQSTYIREKQHSISYKAPEHATTIFAREVGQAIGDSLLVTRIGEICKKIRSFPLIHLMHGSQKHKASGGSTMQTWRQRHPHHHIALMLLTRYMLHQIALAIPAIRRLSLWAIDVNARVALAENEPVQGPPITNKSNKGFLSKIGTSVKRSSSSSPLREQTVQTSQLRRVNELKEKEPTGPKVTIPKVQVGFFREEDVQGFLDSCSDERAAAAGTKEKGLEDAASSDRALQDVIEEAPWTFGLPKGPLYVIKRCSLDGGVREEEDEDEGAAESLSTASKVVDFLHAEVVRCTVELKESTFNVSTGHTLLAVTGEVMQDLFQNPQEENEKSQEFSSMEPDKSSPRPDATKPKPKPVRPPVNNPQIDIRYFLAVKATGVGGDRGWGVVGENVCKQLGRVISAYEDFLGKLTDTEAQKQ